LRLCNLVGDDQPFFAIQSRACSAPEREHPTIERMATDYASVIHDARPKGPYRLLGWSLGGLVAHAVAFALEQRGERVEVVGMIDVPAPGAAPLDALMLALTGIIYDYNPAPPPPPILTAKLRPLRSHGDAPDEVVDHCERLGLLPRGAVTPAMFDAARRLYARHAELVRAHEPPVIRSPIALWWAEHPSSRSPWAACTLSEVREKVVGGTHYTIVQPPLIDIIAADLR
jgi:thioesterase domain-containing protein